MTALTTKLVVDALHPGVRIDVLDADYRVRTKGYGRIEGDLPTGLYTVRYTAADAAVERDITLRPGEPLILDEPPELEFGSAAPLDLTWTSHEYHQEHARRLSQSSPLERGHGGELFVFVRDVPQGGPRFLTKGLSLHRLDGEMLLKFDQVVEQSTVKDEARWAGRNIALDPGVYRLRLSLGRWKAVEMAVVVCPHWQSQVFLLRQGGESEVAGRTIVDLPGATQLMVAGQGFEPVSHVRRGRVDAIEAGEDLRLAELARQALAHDRRGIHTRDLQMMLDGKWQDPLLGIFGVHLLLMRPEPDLVLAERVVQRLRDSILLGFRHPDVEVLAIEIARRRGAPIDVLSFDAPPLLRRSWRMLVQATAEQPSLIPPGALTARVADRLWGAGAWLIWEAPREVPAPRRGGEPPLLPLEGEGGATPQLRIEEFSDRVIIGGVPLFKRDALRLEEPVSGGKDETAETQAVINDEASVALPSASDISTEDRDVLERILGNPDFMSIARGLAERPQVTREQLASLGFPAMRTAIELLLPRLAELLEQFELEDLARKAKLDATEFALLAQLATLIQTGRRAHQTQVRDPLALTTLVEQLELPAERVQSAMAGLFLKLLVVLRRTPSHAKS